MPTSALVGCETGAEAPPAAPCQLQPPTPRQKATGVIVADLGGPPAARVVLMSFSKGQGTGFRTLGRPARVRPDWN